ncbi:hypothetical protein MTO96_036214 [Rhipicephalus appendiculatus]
MWQEWWRKQVHDARHDAAAVAEVQRSTRGSRAPGFRGRVLQLTGTLRQSGVTDLPFQEQADVPAAAMEVVVESTDEAAGVRSAATQAHDPPRGAERVATAPVLQRPVRPPRRPRPRRVDILSAMSAQGARGVEQGGEILRTLHRIELSTTRLAVGVERTAAAQERILRELRHLARALRDREN